MFTSQHWRERAIELRRQAQQATDALARETLVKIADNYDERARRAEELEREYQ